MVDPEPLDGELALASHWVVMALALATTNEYNAFTRLFDDEQTAIMAAFGALGLVWIGIVVYVVIRVRRGDRWTGSKGITN